LSQTLKPILLVTGGGRGIGAATAVLAASQGWAVAVNYAQDAESAARVVAQIETAGGQARAFQANVAEEAEVMSMFEAIDAHMGRLTGLVNNAGVVDVYARVDEMSLALL
jgi:NAD(P)-dependent dehydrogenase (short-subunit alcohol dehydrogenase family)